jgi:hypothetical protein
MLGHGHRLILNGDIKAILQQELGFLTCPLSRIFVIEQLTGNILEEFLFSPCTRVNFDKTYKKQQCSTPIFCSIMILSTLHFPLIRYNEPLYRNIALF